MGKIRKHKVFDWLTMTGHDESRSGPPLWSTQQTPRRPDLGGAFCTTLSHVYKAQVLKPSRQGRPCPERHRAGGKLSSIPTTPEDRAPIVAEPSRLRKHGVIRPLPGDLGRAGVQNGLVKVDDIKTRGPMANRAPDHLRVVQKNAEGFEVSMQEPGIAKGLLCHVAPPRFARRPRHSYSSNQQIHFFHQQGRWDPQWSSRHWLTNQVDPAELTAASHPPWASPAARGPDAEAPWWRSPGIYPVRPVGNRSQSTSATAPCVAPVFPVLPAAVRQACRLPSPWCLFRTRPSMMKHPHPR